jgi:hypothetical protein
MLCKSGVLLEQGQVKSIGNIATIVDQYVNEDTSKSSIEIYYKEKERDPDITANYIRISSFKLLDRNSVAIHQGNRLKGRITIDSLQEVQKVRFRITILNMSGSAISMSTMREELQVKNGETTFDFQLDTSMLAAGTYSLSFALVINDKQVIDVVRKGFYFEIISNPQLIYNVDWQPQWFGNISGFELKRIDGFS